MKVVSTVVKRRELIESLYIINVEIPNLLPPPHQKCTGEKTNYNHGSQPGESPSQYLTMSVDLRLSSGILSCKKLFCSLKTFYPVHMWLSFDLFFSVI